MATNNFISRVYSYPIVQYASDTAKGYYDSAKLKNSYVKASLETVEQYSQTLLHKAETYTQQPPVDSLLHKIDAYGCKQLDKIENGSTQIKKVYGELKPKTIQSLDNAANKIHGTTIEAGLLKTIVFVDTVVDSLFPAPEPTEETEETTEGETDDSSSSSSEKKDINVVEASAPVINKLFDRVNPHSLLLLPSRSYHISRDLIFQAESVPQINYCIGVLTTSAQRIKQGAALTKGSVDHIYASLHHVVGLTGKVVQLMARLDTVEAKASVAELINMIQASKAQFTQNVEQDYESWKKEKDIAAILQKTGELLATQAALGYDKIQHSNHASIRNSVAAIQGLVNGIVERFGPAPTASAQPSD